MTWMFWKKTKAELTEDQRAALKRLVGEAKFEIAGSGNIKAAGTAQKSSVAIAGSGNVETGGVQAKTASVSIAGSGDVRVHASDTADISIAGSGNVDATT